MAIPESSGDPSLPFPYLNDLHVCRETAPVPESRHPRVRLLFRCCGKIACARGQRNGANKT